MRKDGSQFWASVTITPVHDHGNQLCGFIKITRDMTERKRLEELEASTHRLSVFIAMLAHELRNHLAPLRHSVGILQNLADPAPALARCRDAVDRQVGQLTRLVDDLLDVGRITAGKVELDDRPVTVRDIVCRGVESIQPKLAARGQHIHVDLPPDPCCCTATMHGSSRCCTTCSTTRRSSRRTADGSTSAHGRKGRWSRSASPTRRRYRERRT
ncbi:Blue-light-activated histidine kinase [Burkholderia cepacia]|nr:Blue-light-activated histidine kinase [Burkholderia cepacia]